MKEMNRRHGSLDPQAGAAPVSHAFASTPPPMGTVEPVKALALSDNGIPDITGLDRTPTGLTMTGRAVQFVSAAEYLVVRHIHRCIYEAGAHHAGARPRGGRDRPPTLFVVGEQLAYRSVIVHGEVGRLASTRRPGRSEINRKVLRPNVVVRSRTFTWKQRTVSQAERSIVARHTGSTPLLKERISR